MWSIFCTEYYPNETYQIHAEVKLLTSSKVEQDNKKIKKHHMMFILALLDVAVPQQCWANTDHSMGVVYSMVVDP